MKKWLTNLLLVFFLIIGIALVFNNQLKNWLLKTTSESYTISHVTKEEIKENNELEATFDFDAVEAVNAERVLKAQLSNKVLPVIGGIAIPSVKINLPIFKGLSNESLMYGAGTFSADQQMGHGNYSLASHRIEQSDILFTPLHQTAIGANIYLTDLENIYIYRAIESKRIEATDVYVIDEREGETLVTLITCGEAAGVTRWMVQGEFQKKISIEDASEKMLAAFQLKQKTF